MKRIWKIIVIGVCSGLVLVALQMALHIDRDVFLRWYWAAAAVVVLGAVLVNVGYNIFYQKRMQKLVPLLEAQKPREYIAGVEQLLKTAKGQSLRNILTMNLSAGYIDLKEFSKAIELLEGISDRRLVGTAVKTVCRLNLCTCYFQTGQGEKALMLYRDSQSIFEPQRKGCTGETSRWWIYWRPFKSRSTVRRSSCWTVRTGPGTPLGSRRRFRRLSTS